MLVAIVILLLFIASALLGAMYSHFTAFMVNFRDIQQYNKAYYSALAGLERAQLVLRHRSPGYEGSGGRIGDTSYGMFASGDRRPMGDFSFLSATGEEGGVFWEIRSRTTQIPRS